MIKNKEEMMILFREASCIYTEQLNSSEGMNFYHYSRLYDIIMDLVFPLMDHEEDIYEKLYLLSEKQREKTEKFLAKV